MPPVSAMQLGLGRRSCLGLAGEPGFSATNLCLFHCAGLWLNYGYGSDDKVRVLQCIETCLLGALISISAFCCSWDGTVIVIVAASGMVTESLAVYMQFTCSVLLARTCVLFPLGDCMAFWGPDVLACVYFMDPLPMSCTHSSQYEWLVAPC